MDIKELVKIRDNYRNTLISEINARLAKKQTLDFTPSKPPFVRFFLEIITVKRIYIRNGHPCVDGHAGLGATETEDNIRTGIEVENLQTDCIEILLSRMMGVTDTPSDF